MNLSPPPPPPPQPPSSLFHLPIHTSSGNSFPVIAIALIGILATAFLLVGYYVFVIKCCLNWHRLDVLSRFSSRRHHSPNDAVSSSEDAPKGLDEAVIRSIPVIKFRKLPEQERGADTINRKNINQTIPKSTNTNAYECAVCLSEFEDDERLRVIPNCCHAFHIDCIDIWLQSNANCPLCRSTISLSSILHNNVDRILLNPPPLRPLSPPAPCAGGNNADDDSDYVVIEIQGNNLDHPRFVSEEMFLQDKKKHGKKKLEHVCSMGDEWIDMRKKDEEFKDVVQHIRRSISMDLSVDREFCLEIQQCSSKLVSSEDYSSSTNISGSKVRRSIFSFGHGRRSSRGSNSVQPLHLDP